MQILTIVLPIFLIILAGYFFRKYQIADEGWVSVLNNFVYNISLPAIIITSFWDLNWGAGDSLKVLFFNIFVLLVFSAAVLFVLSLLKISRKIKAAVFLTVMVGNTVYMGFPILSQAFPKNFDLVVAAASVHLILSMLFAVLVGEFFVERTKEIKVYILDFLKNPLMIALILGFLLSFLHFRGAVADVIKKPISMLSATASPIALFALGCFFYKKSILHRIKITLATSAAKLVFYSLFILILAKFIHFSSLGSRISALVAGMPTAVTAFVIAERYKLEEDLVANAILISTAISIVTISIFLLKLM